MKLRKKYGDPGIYPARGRPASRAGRIFRAGRSPKNAEPRWYSCSFSARSALINSTRTEREAAPSCRSSCFPASPFSSEVVPAGGGFSSADGNYSPFGDFILAGGVLLFSLLFLVCLVILVSNFFRILAGHFRDGTGLRMK